MISHLGIDPTHGTCPCDHESGPIYSTLWIQCRKRCSFPSVFQSFLSCSNQLSQMLSHYLARPHPLTFKRFRHALRTRSTSKSRSFSTLKSHAMAVNSRTQHSFNGFVSVISFKDRFSSMAFKRTLTPPYSGTSLKFKVELIHIRFYMIECHYFRRYLDPEQRQYHID